VIQVPKNLGKKRQHASVAVEVDTDAGDDNEDTFEAYNGYMDDEPWSDEEDDMRKD
jgi:flagellar biosynthesis/type III secretory pathway M-ring protein FliF/YscJ